MNQLLARLTPIAGAIQAQVGDAFNMQNLVNLFKQVETINETDAQMSEATEYAKYIPTKPTNNVVGGGEVLKRKRGIGKGKRHAGTGTDIPLAEVEYDAVTMPVTAGTIGYQYSILEIQTAMAAGISLDADKAQAARLAAEKHLSDVAWEGEGTVKGFYNQSGVTVVTAQHDWALATIEEVLEDVNASLTPSLTASAFDDAIRPDTYLLPSNQFTILAGRFVADSGGKTFLDVIKEKNIFSASGKKLDFSSIERTNGKGLASTDRAVIYRRDPSCIQFLSDDVQFLAAQPVGVDIKIPGHYKYQGVWLKRVDSMRYLDI
ncbi:DUF2184 domain-containing protein [Acinetobacter indicus]|uniref:DUF2184 domain-containing protein n=1 Tax=Acinetobacter indicus TaxID=756892 RepID=UPI000948DC14|nr:DUF2184 domain-containing protein [Acinetobacter indicus]